jgi:hypothetical protein
MLGKARETPPMAQELVVCTKMDELHLTWHGGVYCELKRATRTHHIYGNLY